jgi:hypothetical protein
VSSEGLPGSATDLTLSSMAYSAAGLTVCLRACEAELQLQKQQQQKQRKPLLLL